MWLTLGATSWVPLPAMRGSIVPCGYLTRKGYPRHRLLGRSSRLVMFPMQFNLLPVFAREIFSVGVAGLGGPGAALGTGALLGSLLMVTIGTRQRTGTRVSGFHAIDAPSLETSCPDDRCKPRQSFMVSPSRSWQACPQRTVRCGFLTACSPVGRNCWELVQQINTVTAPP